MPRLKETVTAPPRFGGTNSRGASGRVDRPFLPAGTGPTARRTTAPPSRVGEAVSKMPQPHHRIGANPVDDLTLTIVGAKRSHDGESGRP